MGKLEGREKLENKLIQTTINPKDEEYGWIALEALMLEYTSEFVLTFSCTIEPCKKGLKTWFQLEVKDRFASEHFEFLIGKRNARTDKRKQYKFRRTSLMLVVNEALDWMASYSLLKAQKRQQNDFCRNVGLTENALFKQGVKVSELPLRANRTNGELQMPPKRPGSVAKGNFKLNGRTLVLRNAFSPSFVTWMSKQIDEYGIALWSDGWEPVSVVEAVEYLCFLNEVDVYELHSEVKIGNPKMGFELISEHVFIDPIPKYVQYVLSELQQGDYADDYRKKKIEAFITNNDIPEWFIERWLDAAFYGEQEVWIDDTSLVLSQPEKIGIRQNETLTEQMKQHWRKNNETATSQTKNYRQFTVC